MRFILSMTAFFALAFVFTACQNTAPPLQTEKAKINTNSATKTNDYADGVPRITLAEAKEDFESGNIVIVDTRAEVAYRQEHIKGAINVPMEAFEQKYKEIPTDKKIIAYCS